MERLRERSGRRSPRSASRPINWPIARLTCCWRPCSRATFPSRRASHTHWCAEIRRQSRRIRDPSNAASAANAYHCVRPRPRNSGFASMQTCHVAKLLMIAALSASISVGAEQSDGGGESAPLPKLTPDATYLLDAAMERVLQLFSIPGMAIGIVENGQPVYIRTFGVRDLNTGERVTVDTQFHAASITKTLTARAVMQLVERNQLTLDAPIGRYVPAFADSPITVK